MVAGLVDGGPTGGGVVPGVLVVPGVIVPAGEVVGVVLPAGGVVPGVVLGNGAAVGGQSVDDAEGLTVVVGGVVPGVLEDGVLGFMPGDGVIVPTFVGQFSDDVEAGIVVELGDGTVPVVDWDVAGFVVVVGIVGVVPGLVEVPDCAPGALVPGIAGVAPAVPVVCAAAIPTQRHSAAMSESTRVNMRISPCRLCLWEGRLVADGCLKTVLSAKCLVLSFRKR